MVLLTFAHSVSADRQRMFNPRQVLVVVALGVLGAASTPAQAALVNPAGGPSTAVAFDTKLSTAALIYDANYYGATEGRLVVLASGATLLGPGVPTGSGTPSQTYLNASDQLRDLVLEVRISNTNGAFISGSVLVPRDINYPGGSGNTADSWTFSGALTSFGFSANPGAGTTNTFDAYWGVNSYDFSDVAANPGSIGAPATCTLGNGGCGQGYLRIGSDRIPFTGGAGSAVDFSVDWVRGTGVISGSTPNAQLGSFDDGIATSAYGNYATSADLFVTPVPIPGALALFAGGLAGLLPVARRRRGHD